MSEGYDPEWVELEKVTGRPTLPKDVHELREMFNAAVIGASKLLPATDPGIQTKDETITSEVKVRVYTPAGSDGKKLPLIVFIHGGGWQAGNLDTEDHLCRTVCGQVGCIIVSVDYRLWPFAEYQSLVDDCFVAYQWAYEHANSLGADEKRCSIWGGSAGVSLAVAVVNKLTTSGQDERVTGLLAMAGTIVHPDTIPEKYKHLCTSYVENGGDVPVVTAERMLEAWEKIIGKNLYADPNLFPLVKAPDAVKSFPRTYIINTDKEALRDDGTVLEAALKDAGVPVKRDVLPALPHYFWCFPVEKAGAKFRQTIVEGVKWMIGSDK